MLLEFNFSNFGPFKDEVSLSLEATAYSEYKEQIRTIGSKKILPLGVIFGANASGKSFVYKAFRYMRYMVSYSVNFASSSSKEKGIVFPEPTPFRLDKDSSEKPSFFEVFITSLASGREVTYQYGFSVLEKRIDSEWLFLLPKRGSSPGKALLKRDKDSISLNVPEMDDSVKRALASSTQKETLLLSLAAKLNVEPFRFILDFFSSSRVNDFASIVEDVAHDHSFGKEIAESEEVRKDCLAFLQSFEPSIIDLAIEELSPDREGGERYRVYAVHLSEEGKEIRFRMDEESAGTQKMFMLYGDLREIILDGSLLFIDELNARLHPLLLRNILLLFLDKEKNPNGAQLIFTCHEPWILRSKTLRRDEIYFANKNGHSGEATLYSLAEFTDDNGVKIRADEDFEKNYLLGKYDGIPSLEAIGVLPQGGAR